MLLSVAESVDGYIDDSSPQRLLLSSAEDFDRVDQVRADSDAILVGAETIRRDNPRLTVKSEARQADRVAAGKSPHPLKVTVTASGNLDPAALFWHEGAERRPVIYTTTAGAAKLADRIADLAEVVSLGATVDFGALLDDLGRRGVRRLMVEGGSRIHGAFLSAGLVDELHVAVGPKIVADPDAPRFVDLAAFNHGPTRMRLIDVAQIGDVALLRYQPPKETDR
ncbi:RibD family protein [Nocardia brasiliensis]|uniref:RibD family protein n=1 Tax=Nocardia brasiliensis TaxID=37326 RepID=UPI0024569663|nr:dihydrofolate reductase family protein [Nocardia brasiliensis]